jgi:hypothetical protein
MKRIFRIVIYFVLVVMDVATISAGAECKFSAKQI